MLNCRSIHRFSASVQSGCSGICRKQSRCWAIGLSGAGAGSVFDESSIRGRENGSLFGALSDSSSPQNFETHNVEFTQETIDFFVSDAEGDPDCPSEGYSSIEQAINSIRHGKVSRM